VRIASPLLRQGRIAIEIRFPYGTGQADAADWTRPDAQETVVRETEPGAATFARRLDDDRYEVAARWSPKGTLERVAKHELVVTAPKGSENLELTLAFTPQARAVGPPSFDETSAAARDHWARFWSTGGAIDLSGSKDPRRRELEAHRPLAIPHRDPVRGDVTAAGNGPDLQ
jgi:hypothetical protein